MSCHTSTRSSSSPLTTSTTSNAQLPGPPPNSSVTPGPRGTLSSSVATPTNAASASATELSTVVTMHEHALAGPTGFSVTTTAPSNNPTAIPTHAFHAVPRSQPLSIESFHRRRPWCITRFRRLQFAIARSATARTAGRLNLATDSWCAVDVPLTRSVRVARSPGGLNPAEPQSPHVTQVAYKFLDVEGRGPYTGVTWTSGELVEAASLSPCREGVCTPAPRRRSVLAGPHAVAARDQRRRVHVVVRRGAGECRAGRGRRGPRRVHRGISARWSLDGKMLTFSKIEGFEGHAADCESTAAWERPVSDSSPGCHPVATPRSVPVVH